MKNILRTQPSNLPLSALSVLLLAKIARAQFGLGDDGNETGNSFSGGRLVGTIIAIVLVCLLFLCLCCTYFRRRRTIRSGATPAFPYYGGGPGGAYGGGYGGGMGMFGGGRGGGGFFGGRSAGAGPKQAAGPYPQTENPGMNSGYAGGPAGGPASGPQGFGQYEGYNPNGPTMMEAGYGSGPGEGYGASDTAAPPPAYGKGDAAVGSSPYPPPPGAPPHAYMPGSR